MLGFICEHVCVYSHVHKCACMSACTCAQVWRVHMCMHVLCVCAYLLHSSPSQPLRLSIHSMPPSALGL